MKVLDPEIDGLPVGTHEVLGHLLERRRTEGTNIERQILDSADDQERAVFDVVVGVVVGDMTARKPEQASIGHSFCPLRRMSAVSLLWLVEVAQYRSAIRHNSRSLCRLLGP